MNEHWTVELRKARELGSSVIACRLDVRDERSVAACVARAREWGGIDILPRSSGVF
jgi:NADP-dependent 3-hydroxy acid dehydrogenase YdfG